jgi:HK97 family phage prohead protease
MSDPEIRARIVEGLELRDGDDGTHQLRGVVAPYGEAYDAGEYVETFAAGVFAKSVRQRGDSIGLTEQHLAAHFPIGRSVAWEDTADGLVGTFRLAPTDRGMEALALITSGFLDGLSVGFRPLRNRTDNVGGRRHIERVEAVLDHVGLVNTPAYQQARVLEARNDDTPPAFDPDSLLTAPRLARQRALLGLRA